MQLNGMQAGSDYVLQMDFSNEIETPGDQMYDVMANKGLFLGILAGSSSHGTVWENAVDANVSSQILVKGFPSNSLESVPAVGPYAWHPTASGANFVDSTTPSNQPYLGSFQSFLNSTYIQGGTVHYFYEHSLDQLRGTWGIDTSTDTAWAVLDVGSGIFAVVPEPASIRLLAGAMLSLAVGFWWRRRARIRAAEPHNSPSRPSQNS